MTKEEKRVKQLIQKLAELGQILPGSISEQWNVCGKKGCRCKDPENPVKHGPYYQLSYTVGGKGSTMFVKESDLPEARRCIERYKQFKTLNIELVRAHIDLIRATGFKRGK